MGTSDGSRIDAIAVGRECEGERKPAKVLR